MSTYEDDEMELLAQEDAAERRKRGAYLQHPDPRDPDYPFYDEYEETEE